MRKIALVVYTLLWQLSRLCAAILVGMLALMFVLLIYSRATQPPSPITKYDPNVCGKISGWVFEFPREYVMFWPEYEGKSSWEAGFIHNKKGCDANLRSLAMAMSWPEMKPVSLIEAQSSDFSGIILTISPASPDVSYMRRRLNLYLRYVSLDQRARSSYIDGLGLYYLRGNGYFFRDSESSYYWSEKDGQVEYLIYCPWLEQLSKYSTCDLFFLLPKFRAFVSVDLPPERLMDWREFVMGSIGFLEAGVKLRSE